jgi:hypothetical protein
MRNLLALIGLAVVGFAGIGWYMGWYKLSFSRSSDGNLEIKTDVNTQKVGADSTEALKNLGAAIGTHVQKAAQDAKSTAPTNAPGGTPGPVTPAQNSTSNSLAPTGAIEPTSSVTPTIPTTPVTPPVSPSVPGPIKLVPPK